MKIPGGKTLALYGTLGVGAYFFVTYLLPKIAAGLGKSAGDTGAAAATALAKSAGKIGGSVIMAAPSAINAAAAQLGLPEDSLAILGGALGRGIYAATHLFSPDPTEAGDTWTVSFADGSRHAILKSVVDSRGRFKYKEVMYQIKDDAQGRHWATRL